MIADISGRVIHDEVQVVTSVSFDTIVGADGNSYVHSVIGHRETIPYVNSIVLTASKISCAMFGASKGGSTTISLPSV